MNTKTNTDMFRPGKVRIDMCTCTCMCMCHSMIEWQNRLVPPWATTLTYIPHTSCSFVCARLHRACVCVQFIVQMSVRMSVQSSVLSSVHVQIGRKCALVCASLACAISCANECESESEVRCIINGYGASSSPVFFSSPSSPTPAISRGKV